MTRETILLTGASSGIGHALALRLARDGHSLILCARREAQLEALAQSIRSQGGSARVEAMDVAEHEKTVDRIRALDEQILNENGDGITMVIANAGVGEGKDHPSYAWETVRGSCQINFTGAAATVTAILPRMVARKRGHIVAVSSLASFGPLPQSASYCAAKAGLSMLMDCLRLDIAHAGVHSTTVHVGFVKTDMTAKSKHPMPQLMEVDYAANFIVDRLKKAPATIDFPQPLAALTWGVGRLPRPMRDLVQRGLAKVR
jgi:short-subunit dehydrogenase